MGVFAEAGVSVGQIDNAKPMDNVSRLKHDGPGLYVVQVQNMRLSKSKNEGSGTDGWPSFQVDFTVLENTSGVVSGVSRSWGQLINNGQSKSARQDAERQLGDCKACIAAAMGFRKNPDGTPKKDEQGRPVQWSPADVKAAHFDTIEENPLKFEGRKMIAEVGEIRKPTKPGGHEFIPVKFRPYTDEEAARITATAKNVTPKATPTQQQPTQQQPTQPNIPAPASDDSEEW